MEATGKTVTIKAEIYESSTGRINLCITHDPIAGTKLPQKKYIDIEELTKRGYPYIGNNRYYYEVVTPIKQRVKELNQKLFKSEQARKSMRARKDEINAIAKAYKAIKEHEEDRDQN